MGMNGTCLVLSLCFLGAGSTRSVIEHTEHGGGPSNPDTGLNLGWHVHMDNEVGGLTGGGEDTSTLTSLVARTSVLFDVSHVVFLGLEPKHRHFTVQFTGFLIINYLFISVVTSTIHVESVHVNTVFWCLIDIFDTLGLKDVERELKLVDGNLVTTGVSLQGTSQETLREEQTRDPEGHGGTVLQPVVHEDNTLLQVNVPGGKWLKGWVTNLSPVSRHLVVLKGQVHLIEDVGHNDETMNSLLKIRE